LQIIHLARGTLKAGAVPDNGIVPFFLQIVNWLAISYTTPIKLEKSLYQTEKFIDACSLIPIIFKNAFDR